MTDLLKTGQLARRTGVSPDTIRHYERLGLLQKGVRTTAGYRLFPPEAVPRVRLIRDAIRVGFSLRQLATFLRVRQAGGAPCREVRAAAAQILGAVDTQIAELTSTRAALQRMLDEWDTRLAATPSGRPARLLDALAAGAMCGSRQPGSNLRRGE
jgi:DNA-binding transcriptional MerR regulator